MAMCDCAFDKFLQAFKEALCMPEFPVMQSAYSKSYGSVPASTKGTTLTQGSFPAKGSYVELVAATEKDTNWILVHLGNFGDAGTAHLVDVAIGGAGSETVIIPDLICAGKIGGNFGSYLFPMFIPKGSRISAALSGFGSADISINLFGGAVLAGGSPPSVVSTYDCGSPFTPVKIDPGATANTDSAWVELTPATARDHQWLALALRPGDSTLVGATGWLVDLGIGASGSEQEIIGDLLLTAEGQGDHPGNQVLCFPYYIPGGTRLVARLRSSVSTSGDRSSHVKVYGV